MSDFHLHSLTYNDMGKSPGVSWDERWIQGVEARHDERAGTDGEWVGMASLSYAGHRQNGRPTAKWNVKSRERRG